MSASQEYTTYSDDASLGKAAPSLGSLEYIQGNPVSLGDGKITVILFFAKFAKGDYTTVRALPLPPPCTVLMPSAEVLALCLALCCGRSILVRLPWWIRLLARVWGLGGERETCACTC